MDHLIFYKKKESLRESLSKIRMNDSVSYTQYFLRDHRQISEIQEIHEERVILYYFAEILKEEDKLAIKNLYLDYPRLKIVLFSDSSHALDAWRIGVFHFDTYPVSSDMVINAYNKWQKSQFEGNLLHELTIKTDDGIHKLLYKDVHYIQAAGNYTMIHYGSTKCMLLSRQLGTFSDLYEKEPNFKRVHRSLILNFQNVKSCKDQLVSFRDGCKPLSVSSLLENKIKKLLLQNT